MNQQTTTTAMGGGWQRVQNDRKAEQIPQHFVHDPVQVMLHQHPEFIKVLFGKVEEHRRRSFARYRLRHGLHAKDQLQMELAKPHYEEGSSEFRKQYDYAAKGLKIEKNEALIGYDKTTDTWAPVTDTMELDTEHFFDLLLDSFVAVHQQNMGVYKDHDNYDYKMMPNAPADSHEYRSYLTPLGQEVPQYNNQGQYQKHQLQPGYYYGQQGYPPQEHENFGPQHKPSGGMAKTLGVLATAAAFL